MKKIILIIVMSLCFGCTAHAGDEARKHVYNLSEKIGRRNPLYYQKLEQAADYIKREFQSYGYRPEEQVYTRETMKTEKRPFRNIIAVKEGGAKKNKTILICSHYDTVRDSPGADDDASGVAAVLELARLLYKEDLDKTVKFAAFSTEELPLVFEDPDMGSFRYAKEAREKGEDIEAVICLDMIGFYSDEKGSQHYPIPFNFFYPDKGNFIGFGADIASYDLLRDAVAEFKRSSDMPVEYLVAPTPFVPQIMTSDNRSFWTFGYKSVWVTDTCIYRNPYMHTANDKYETLDYDRMSKVISGICAVILKLDKI